MKRFGVKGFLGICAVVGIVLLVIVNVSSRLAESEANQIYVVQGKKVSLKSILDNLEALSAENRPRAMYDAYGLASDLAKEGHLDENIFDAVEKALYYKAVSAERIINDFDRVNDPLKKHDQAIEDLISMAKSMQKMR